MYIHIISTRKNFPLEAGERKRLPDRSAGAQVSEERTAVRRGLLAGAQEISVYDKNFKKTLSFPSPSS